jgi:NAD-dependent SIR2 family protein deacetylase
VVIEVNPEETPLTRAAEVSIRGAAAEVVPQLVNEE